METMTARASRRYHAAPAISEALSVPTLADRILFCREARGLSQRALAQQMGIAWSQISLWENAKFRPGLDVFFELARALDVDPVELYHGVSS